MYQCYALEKQLADTFLNRAMFNVLVVLLHRPFVSDGDLHSNSSSIALDAFPKCSSAAFEIDHILKTYEKSFCLKTSRYIISYATYISAIIHVRLATQRYRGFEAHEALRRCLDVLDIHQSFCWDATTAKRVVDRLIVRMGVVLETEGPPDKASNLVLSNLDIDAIIRSFEQE